MKIRLVLTMLALLPLAVACNGPSTAPGATAPAAEPAPAATEAAPPATTEAAPAEAGAEASSEAAAPAAPNTNPVVAPEGPAPVAGTDYEALPTPARFGPADGSIEVVEVFSYICPACAAFQPSFSAWKARQPADVKVTYVPIAFNEQWLPYAQSFYAAEAKGLEARTHDEVFKKIHLERSLPGEGQKPDPAKVAAFYATYGVDAKEFENLMKSFGVQAKLQKGMAYAKLTGTNSTPTLIINGKYRILGRSWEDKLRIADHLIAQERAAQ